MFSRILQKSRLGGCSLHMNRSRKQRLNINHLCKYGSEATINTTLSAREMRHLWYGHSNDDVIKKMTNNVKYANAQMDGRIKTITVRTFT